MLGKPTFSLTFVTVSCVAGVDLHHLEGLNPLEDEPLVAVGARTRDLLERLKHLGGIGTADDGRDAEFAGDDRGVRGAAALLGKDERRLLHERLPVGRRQLGDQNVARVEDVLLLGDVLEALTRRET